jgi:transposase-like protein
MERVCPSCQSKNIKKNGKTHYGKHNHKCKECKRQFVAGSSHIKSDELKVQVKKALSR